MENYIFLEMIGEGAFGKVYKGQRKCTNQIVAIKKIGKKGKKEKELRNLRQEIDISRRLYHENIVQLLDSFETNSEFCLVSELATGQLFEIIEEDKKLPEAEIKKIAQQLTSALFYLHSNNIIHRDIKPQNILISASGVIKVCDFGFARLIDNKTMITSIKGTPLYMAPELLKEYPYNKKADLWSLGVILYELYVGQPPFYTNSFPTLMNKIMKEEIRYPDSMSIQFKEFLKGLLVKDPKDRWDWPKILEHPFIKQNENEKKLLSEIQDNYRKWIIRLKNDKIFNLYESESYLQKFANDIEVESGTKNFSTFDADNKPTSGKRSVSSTSFSNVDSTSTYGSLNKSDFWTTVETKSCTEEGATSLRKDQSFADQVSTALKAVIKDEKIIDKKLACIIIKILFNVLTKGKFDNQNIDITKNQNILTQAIQVFRIAQQDEGAEILLNDIIKVIGLFIKFYCFCANGVDLSICTGFLRYVPNVLMTSGRTPNLYINMLKALGLMITAANMVPKRSLLFYKSIIDFKIIDVLFKVIMNYKNQQFVITKSCIECLSILIYPTNGEIHSFPFLRNETMENKFQDYNDVKTAFNHIEILKTHFFKVCLDEKIFELFPVLYETESDLTLKMSIIKILIQLMRHNPKDMFSYFCVNNGPYVKLINSASTSEDINQKILIQLGILLLMEVVKYGNKVNVNITDCGFDTQKILNYLNRLFQMDNITLCLTFGLLAELMNNSKYWGFNAKYIKKIKDIIRNSPGRGRDDNKKLEGTSFGYLSVAILDYPLLYLEKVMKMINTKEKIKTEIISSVMECQFEDILVDIISNSSFRNEISPKGVNSALLITNDLIHADYKMIIRKILREHCMKHLIVFIKRKQHLAIQDWPGYFNKNGSEIASSIFCTTLKIIKISAELNGITEEIVRGDFLGNLRNAFDIIGKEYYKLIVNIFNTMISGKHDENVTSILIEYFSKPPNLKFIETYSMLKDPSQKELIIEILLFLSSICRKSAEVYNAINQLNIFKNLKFLLENTNESSYKTRICNLLGNMCRHSDFFYIPSKESGIIKPLLACCYDSDKATRKFACFAIGNMAFLNDHLYEDFRPIIPRLVELLNDTEENTRANAAGALGNFVRCGDSLCKDMIECNAHEALLSLAEKEDVQTIQIIRVALFALGNFCYHSMIKANLQKINFLSRIENIKNKYKNDGLLQEHFERIKKKLGT